MSGVLHGMLIASGKKSPPEIVSTNQGNAVGSHQAGDFLLAFNYSTPQASASSGWTELHSQSTSWSYDAYRVVYRIASSSSTGAPFTGTSGINTVYAIRFASQIESSANGTFTQAPGVVPSISQSTGSLRFTLLTGYAGGGNGWNSASTDTGTGFTRVVETNYAVLWRGGTGTLSVSAPNYGMQSVRYITLSVAE